MWLLICQTSSRPSYKGGRCRSNTHNTHATKTITVDDTPALRHRLDNLDNLDPVTGRTVVLSSYETFCNRATKGKPPAEEELQSPATRKSRRSKRVSGRTLALTLHL